VLPVPSFENDTTAFIKDESSKLSFQTFMEDSRKLFSKYNVQLKEISHQLVKQSPEVVKPEDE
jgi:peptidase E